MKIPALILILISFVLDDLTNIAVNELTPIGITPGETALITERLRTEIVQLGRFHVMERAEMDVIVEEMEFQQSGMCDESECLVELGQILGVEKIISGTVGKIGDLYTISLKLINVETAHIENSVSEDNRNGLEEFYTISLKNAALKLVGEGKMVPKSSPKTDLKLVPNSADNLSLYNQYRISPNRRINGERTSIRNMIKYSARINSGAESEYRKARGSLFAGTVLAMAGVIAMSNSSGTAEERSSQIVVGMSFTASSIIPLIISIRKSARGAERYDRDLQKYYGL